MKTVLTASVVNTHMLTLHSHATLPVPKPGALVHFLYMVIVKKMLGVQGRPRHVHVGLLISG